jgi:hypothetical protein
MQLRVTFQLLPIKENPHVTIRRTVLQPVARRPNQLMKPIRRYFLRALTTAKPSLSYLWHGDTLRSRFTYRGYRVELHQELQPAYYYYILIDSAKVGPFCMDINEATIYASEYLKGQPRK